MELAHDFFIAAIAALMVSIAYKRKIGKGIRYMESLPLKTQADRDFASGYSRALQHMNEGIPKERRNG